jgi:hypothetical protein
VVENHVNSVFVAFHSATHLLCQYSYLDHMENRTYDDAGSLILEVRMMPPFFSSMDVGYVQLAVSLIQ